MIDLVIEISGPGETFSGPMQVIIDALKELKCNVSVEDTYPYDEEQVKHIISKRNPWKGTNVLIKTEHQPWGG